MLDRLVAVWARVPTTDTRDEAAFRDVYADPVTLNERITRIWVVADELGRLTQLEAISLAAPAADP